MARKKRRPDEALTKLRQVDVLIWRRQFVAAGIRARGVTEVTSDRWQVEFGGPKSDEGKRRKRLEADNARLRKAIAGLTLDMQIIAGQPQGA